MTKSALAISLAILVGINAAAHSQSSVIAKPVLEGTAHPGTALLDSAGIYAGVQTPNVVPVHPGTALLDSMGIFAGERIAVPIVDGSTAAGETVTLK